MTTPTPPVDTTVSGGGAVPDFTEPRVMLSRARVVKTRRSSVVVLATRCNERCRVDVKVFDRRRLVVRRAGWRPAARAASVALPVRRASRTRTVVVLVSVRDAAGNATQLVRTVRV